MIEALGDNIIIKPIKEPAQIPSGISFSDRMEKDPKFGIVRFIGPDVKSLRCGNTVAMPGWNDGLIEIDGTEYHMFQEKNINVRIS